MPCSLLALFLSKKLHRHRSCRCKGGARGVCRAVEPNKVERRGSIGFACRFCRTKFYEEEAKDGGQGSHSLENVVELEIRP